MITVGVPVHRGRRWVAETLRSIQSQTLAEFEVLISVDGPSRGDLAACRPFLDDPRFRLVVQPQRLGWVANASWLMQRASTPFFCLQAHDDVMDERYLEVLVAAAREAPRAAVCFCDIGEFGTGRGGGIRPVHVQRSVTGDSVARELTLLREHFAAVAFRGVTRVEAIRLGGGVPSNEVDSYACDTAWMAAVARWGELVRVPGALYRKRYHRRSEHTRWARWPLDKRIRAWTFHCAAMLEQALAVSADAGDRRRLWAAAAERLGSPELAGDFLGRAELALQGRDALLDRLIAAVESRGIDLPARLDADAPAVRRWGEGSLAASY